MKYFFQTVERKDQAEQQVTQANHRAHHIGWSLEKLNYAALNH